MARYPIWTVKAKAVPGWQSSRAGCLLATPRRSPQGPGNPPSTACSTWLQRDRDHMWRHVSRRVTSGATSAEGSNKQNGMCRASHDGRRWPTDNVPPLLLELLLPFSVVSTENCRKHVFRSSSWPTCWTYWETDVPHNAPICTRPAPAERSTMAMSQLVSFAIPLLNSAEQRKSPLCHGRGARGRGRPLHNERGVNCGHSKTAAAEFLVAGMPGVGWKDSEAMAMVRQAGRQDATAYLNRTAPCIPPVPMS